MDSKSNFQKLAKDYVNTFYQPLGYLKCQVSSNTMWQYAKERALENIKLFKSETPMYTGNLDPKWDYWNQMEKAINNL